MLLFCPTCGNVLIVEEGQKCYRFACNTCPYIHNVTRKVTSRKYPKLKEVDDVLGGAAAWENVDSTAESRMRHMTCIMSERQLRHYGHVARLPEGDPAPRTLIVGDPSGWARPMGRPCNTWLRQMVGHFRRVRLDRMSAWGGVANRDLELFRCVVGAATCCASAGSPT
ncbi:RPC10 polymerase, partial [Polypterus senegalus]